MSDLRLTVLGCDGSYPGPGGACSGFLVRTESTSVLLDAGTGTLANLQLHMAPQDLDAVVITHEHPDHSANIYDLRVLYKVSTRSLTGMPVYASPGVLEAQFPRGDHALHQQLQHPRLGRVKNEFRRHREQRDFGKIRRTFGFEIT